jgi:hypothetical protein
MIAPSIGKNAEPTEFSYAAGRSVNSSNHLGNCLAMSIEAKLMPVYDPAIPSIGVYPREMTAKGLSKSGL